MADTGNRKIKAIILDLETSSDRTLIFEQVKAKYLTGDQVPVVSFCRTELDKEAPRIAHKTYKDYERCISKVAGGPRGIRSRQGVPQNQVLTSKIL